MIYNIIASEKLTVEPAQVLAHVKIESGFNQLAVNPSDPSYGLMQITPYIASAFGARSDSWKTDPIENLIIGMKFLSELNRKYNSVYDNAERYNLGETKYNRGKRVPQYREKFSKWYRHYKKIV